MVPHPKVTVHYEPQRPRPGDEILVDVDLRCTVRTKLNAVKLSLIGTEKVTPEHGTVSAVKLVVELAGRVLAPGLHTLSARFALPEDAPPSLWLTGLSMEYVLRVYLDIPWQIDMSKDFVIPVEPALSPAEPVGSGPVRGTFQGTGPDDMRFEVSLEQTTLAPGEELSGHIALAGFSPDEGVDVDVAFVSSVRKRDAMLSALGTEPPAEPVARYEAELHRDHPVGGGAIPFRVGLPEEARSTFRGRLATHEWEVLIKVKTRSGARGTVRIPLRVAGSATARETGAPAADVPRVGPARRARAWSSVARSQGLAHDVASERMTLTEGGVQLEITTEEGPAGTLTVALLRWPSLGLDLQLRRLPEVLDDPLRTGDPDLDSAFHVRARETAQAVTFLRHVSSSLLHLHDEQLHVDDRGARLSRGGAAHDERSLWHFTDRAKTFAEVFAGALQHVPPPSGLRRFLPAWRSLCDRLGGRLETGRMWIHDGRWNESPVAVGTTWSREGIAGGTVLRLGMDLPLQARIDAATDTAALPPGVKKVISSLAADLQHATFEPTGIEITLARVALDPEEVAPFFDWLARMGAAFRTSGAFR